MNFERLAPLLVFLLVKVGSAQIPEFTEDFTTNANLYEYNFSLESNKAKDGYVVPYYPSDTWIYEWGNLFYTNGKIYIVWSDQRDDGNNHIYLAKLQSSDLSHLWVSNFQVDETTSLGYRPDITLYDSSSIYISWGADEGGLWRLRAQQIDDTGALPSKKWGTSIRCDTLGDDAHYWVEKIESIISTNTNLYLAVTWKRIGSGDRGTAYGISADGTIIFQNETGLWLGQSSTPPGFPRGCDITFASTNIYITAQGWMWSPSREFGAYIQKLDPQTGTRLWGNYTNLDTRDTIAGYYPDAKVPLIARDGYLYAAWADKRDGDYDVFLQKVNITNGTHPAGWETDKKVNITATGDQLYPDIAFKQTTGSIYVVWKDTTTGELKLMEYKSDGSGRNFGSDVVLSGVSGTPYHPKIVTDESDNIYVAWLEYNDPYYLIKVAKYNASGVLISGGPTNALKVNYMIKSHCISTKLEFSPPALSVKQAVLTNLVASTNGGGIEIYLSHNGGNTWMLATNGNPITFSGEGWDFRYKIVFNSDGYARPEIDDFKIKALEYYTGDLLYSHSSNTNFSGESIIETLASQQELTNYVLADGINKAINYVRLKNTGNVSANFYVYGYGSDANFDVKYFDGATDITSLVTSWTGYLITNLPPDTSKTIRVEITPQLSATEGMEKYIYISSYVGKGEGLHDSIRLKTVARKYYPDLLVKRKNENFIGDDIREYPTVSTQQIWTNANSFISNFEETTTNYLLVQNDGISNDIIKLSATTNVTNGSKQNWIIVVTNITTATKLNLPANLNINAGGSNLIAVLITPKSSSAVNETIELNFVIDSLNTVPLSDPMRMDKAKISVTAIKVQPDLYISSSPAFTNNIGENIYYFTNTSVTQSLLLKTVPEQTLYFYVRIINDGQTPDTINVKVDKLPNTNWQNSYNDGSDITSQITNANGVNYTLSPGSYKTIICAYTPNTNVPSGQTLNLKMIARSLSKNFVTDVVYLKPYSKKLRPDLLISTNGTIFVGSNYFTTNGISQSFYKRLEIETEQTQTYYLKIVNKSPTDPDTIIYKGDSGDSYWSVQYFDTNNNNITSSVTQGSNITLDVSEEFLLRVVVKPSVLTPPDNLKNIFFEIYSDEIPSQRDVSVFSNIGVELKPDLIVVDIGGNTYRDSDYSYQTKSVNSISGVSNSYTIYIQNDGGSIESFRLKAYYSNAGGSITNWIISFRTNGIEITSDVTQAGYLFENLSPSQTIAIELIAYPKFYGLSSTNSAVENKLYIRLNAESVTKPARRDLGTLFCEIKRGMPDIYLEDGYVGRGRYDTTFNETNKFVLGVVLNYPRSTIIWLKNDGIYTDSFNYYVTVVSNDPTKWDFSFTNISTLQDLTSVITNSNIGYSFTNKQGLTKAIKFTIVATQGNVGDRIYFYNYFKTTSEKIRKDRIWYIGQIVDGLPDIAVSNYQDTNLYGWGQGATNDYCNTKIETGETNQFLILLHNEATGGGAANFIFKEIQRSGATSTIEYYTNGSPVPYSAISNGITFSIASSNYTTIKVKIYNTGSSSGDTTDLRYRLTLQGYNDVYDEFILTSTRVDPNIYIGFTNTSSSSQTFYLPKNSETEFYVIITNQDVVAERFRLKATPQDSQYSIRYYYCSNSTTNEITAEITNSSTGWITEALSAGDYVKLKVWVQTAATLTGGDFKIIDIQGAPFKNESKVEHLYAKILVVEGVPDISALDENNNKVGDGKDAPVEYISEKIKIDETNTYKIYLENDIAGTGPVHIIFKEITNYGKDKFNIQYLDKSLSDITYNVTNTGQEFYLTAGGQDYIFLRITGNTNIPSGDKCFVKFKFWMKYEPVNYDEFSITNTMVNPKVNLGVARIIDRIWDFDDYKNSLSYKTIRNVGVTFYIGIRNEDVVPEQMKIKGAGGNSTWDIKYYDELDNEITTEVVAGTYATKTLNYMEFYRIRAYVLPAPSALPADTININISGAPLKNLTQQDTVSVSVTIDCTYVKGRVIDKATGSPIKDATIQITDAYGIKTSGKSDSSGNFAVPVYPQYNVKFVAQADAEGYVGQRKEFISTTETNYVYFELVPLRLSADKLDVRIFPHPATEGSGGNFVYSVPESGETKLMIFDLYGRLVKIVVREYKERGVYYAIWDGTAEDGSRVGRGVYIYVLQTKAGKVVKKLFIK